MTCVHRLPGSVIPLAVATSETWTPSRRLQSAARAERERVQRKLAELDRRHAELADALGEVTASRDELREQLGMLSRLAHSAGDDVGGAERDAHDGPELDLRRLANGTGDHDRESVGKPLRGQAIREAAVRVLATSPRAYDPVHYKDWFGLLRAEGLLPAGKDPLATFLTQLGRSPVITRTSGQGIYMLDHEFPDRARRKLEQLQHELRDAHDAAVGPNVADVAAVRERRSELVTEVERLERELDEALRSLTPAEHPLSATG